MQVTTAGRVGVPRRGEKKCPRCSGQGQLSKRIPHGQFMAGHFMPCDRCHATGVVAER
jgi:DnaJ-class molecular chaperone